MLGINIKIIASNTHFIVVERSYFYSKYANIFLLLK